MRSRTAMHCRMSLSSTQAAISSCTFLKVRSISLYASRSERRECMNHVKAIDSRNAAKTLSISFRLRPRRCVISHPLPQ